MISSQQRIKNFHTMQVMKKHQMSLIVSSKMETKISSTMMLKRQLTTTFMRQKSEMLIVLAFLMLTSLTSVRPEKTAIQLILQLFIVSIILMEMVIQRLAISSKKCLGLLMSSMLALVIMIVIAMVVSPINIVLLSQMVNLKHCQQTIV